MQTERARGVRWLRLLCDSFTIRNPLPNYHNEHCNKTAYPGDSEGHLHDVPVPRIKQMIQGRGGRSHAENKKVLAVQYTHFHKEVLQKHEWDPEQHSYRQEHLYPARFANSHNARHQRPDASRRSAWKENVSDGFAECNG